MILEVELDEKEAMALAQFCKRVGWQEFRANASSVEEAYDVRAGVAAVQEALARKGFAPQ